ncbi:histidine phosphatase family protein [Vibrio brasiliensis]|uniref:histidine phosphatase family protein n=1 Tax=Vibrio brasiliensis TaxID=170652 RepID=UPI001EFDC25D|nr:histidine phosphatase family protein [Vibrio brasiliensis]MCG9785465.1 histidine phosphatase family protein [Vibrio brasiliensis]
MARTNLVIGHNKLPSSSIRLVFIRHGNAEHYGREIAADSSLTDTGENQSIEVCQHLMNHYKVDDVYCSELSRTRNTASSLLESLDMEVKIDCLLNEAHTFKDWQLLSEDVLEKNILSRIIKAEERPVKGESPKDVQSRCEVFLKNISSDYRNYGKTIAIFGHFSWINMLLNYVNGKSSCSNVSCVTEIPNASITELIIHNTHDDDDFGDVFFTIKKVGDVSHLTNCEVTV